MNLADVLDNLIYGELSKSFLGDDGELPVGRYNQMITHVGFAISDLYKRFDLKRASTIINVVDGVYRYPLVPTDLIEVLDVTTAGGASLPMNQVYTTGSEDEAKILSLVPSVSTTEVGVLVVSKGVLPQVLTVHYKANHPKITRVSQQDEPNFDPSLVPIELPEAYMEAVMYFVAARVFMADGVVGMAGRAPFHVGNNYTAKYEAACLQLTKQGIDVGEKIEGGRFYSRGFV